MHDSYMDKHVDPRHLEEMPYGVMSHKVHKLGPGLEVRDSVELLSCNGKNCVSSKYGQDDPPRHALCSHALTVAGRADDAGFMKLIEIPDKSPANVQVGIPCDNDYMRALHMGSVLFTALIVAEPLTEDGLFSLLLPTSLVYPELQDTEEDRKKLFRPLTTIKTTAGNLWTHVDFFLSHNDIPRRDIRARYLGPYFAKYGKDRTCCNCGMDISKAPRMHGLQGKELRRGERIAWGFMLYKNWDRCFNCIDDTFIPDV